MSPLKFTTFSLPSYWAPYLINEDMSGYSDSELALIDEWLADSGLTKSLCVDVSDEPEFKSYHDAIHYELAGECLTYTFQEV